MSLWGYFKSKRRANVAQIVEQEFQREGDFATWLLLQIERDDAVGELVRHITANTEPVDRMGKVFGWWKTACLDNHPSSEKVFLDSFQKAWEEFRTNRSAG